MVTDAEGQVGEGLALPNKASKGQGGGRMIPLNMTLRAARVINVRRPEWLLQPVMPKSR